MAPVLILQKTGAYFDQNGPIIALILAFSLPLGYGVYDYFRRRKKNLVSALGMISVLTTGGLALVQAEGVWFAVTEAALPLLMGIGVFVSAFTKKSFVGALFLNQAVVNRSLIDEKVNARGMQTEFGLLIKHSTIYFSASLLFSAVMNFVLATYIFQPIDLTIGEAERSQMINDQLAQMKSYSILVIAAPAMIISALVMWQLFRGLQKLTGLGFEQLIQAAEETNSSKV